MKSFKKIMAVILAAVLLMVASVAATVAYLTQRNINPQKNVFSVGDIDVSLKEDVAVDGAGSVTAGSTGANYTNLMPGDKLTKKITVTNDGVNPAYVALTVTMNNAKQINDAIDVYYENLGYTDAQIQAMYDKVFNGWGLRYDKVDDAGKALGMRLTNRLPIDSKLLRVDSTKTTGVGDYFFYAYENWFQTDAEENNTGYGMPIASGGYYASDLDPYTFNYTYYLYLAPGESFTPFEGLNVPAEFTREQLAMFKDLQINAVANAIQADNFETADDAFAALAGETTPAIPQTSVSNQAELKAAINEGKKVIYLKTGEYDLNGIMSDGLTLVGPGDGAKVANTTRFASGNSVGAITKAITLENVTLTNTVYTMENGSDATFIDVTFAAGVREAYGKNVKFDGCTFGSNAAGYALHFQTDSASAGGMITLTDCEFLGGKVHLGGTRGYTFTNCEFAAGTDFQVWSDIILDGCTVNGVEVTAANLSTLFPNLNAAKVTFQ